MSIVKLYEQHTLLRVGRRGQRSHRRRPGEQDQVVRLDGLHVRLSETQASSMSGT
jgi:hypothetical protein